MSKNDPTNKELMATLVGFRELMESELGHIKDHLATLNGQVKKNTDFRKFWLAVYKFGGVVCGIVVAIAGIIIGLK